MTEATLKQRAMKVLDDALGGGVFTHMQIDTALEVLLALRGDEIVGLTEGDAKLQGLQDWVKGALAKRAPKGEFFNQGANHAFLVVSMRIDRLLGKPQPAWLTEEIEAPEGETTSEGRTEDDGK